MRSEPNRRGVYLQGGAGFFARASYLLDQFSQTERQIWAYIALLKGVTTESAAKSLI